MGFNKRHIDKKTLQSYKQSGLSYLIRTIKSSDCVIIEDKFSEIVFNIINTNDDKNVIRQKLKDIGFYES